MQGGGHGGPGPALGLVAILNSVETIDERWRRYNGLYLGAGEQLEPD